MTYLIPVSLFASLASMGNLENAISSLSSLRSSSPFLYSILQGFVSTLGLLIFNIFLPYILLLLERNSCNQTFSSIDRNVFRKYFLFQIFNFFLFTIVSLSFLELFAATLTDLASASSLFVSSVTSASAYFSEYILLHGIALYPFLLCRPWPLFRWVFLKTFFSTTQKDSTRAQSSCFLRYGVDVPMILLVFMVSILFSTLCPIIYPFALAFFSMSLFYNKLMVIQVYKPIFETGGSYFDLIFSRICFASLMYVFLTAVCLFFKDAKWQSFSLVPIFVFMIIFSLYNWTVIHSIAKISTIEELDEVDRESKTGRSFYGIELSVSTSNSSITSKLTNVEDELSGYHQPVLRVPPANFQLLIDSHGAAAFDRFEF